MANYYVAKNGNNGWDGSEGTPWLTINYAETQVGSNDTVYIKAGTYSDGRINFSGVHSSGNECRFRAYASDTVIITTRMLVSGDWYIFDDLEFVTSSSSSYSEIEVSGDNNVFNNMYSHDYTGSRWEAGVYIINPASYNTFNNLVMLDGGMIYVPGIQQSTPTGNLFSGGEIGFTNGTGIRFGGESNTVEDMAIHDCGYGNNPGSGADDCDGIVTHGDNHTFRNLRIYNIFRKLGSMHTDSIQWWDYAGNIIIEGCEIGSSRPGGISSDQGHIQMNGEYRNMEIRNNVFMGTGGPYTFNHDAPNTFDADYCKINNNVFRGPERPRYDNYNQRYWEMKNNVIYWDGPDWEAGAGWDVDNNIYVNANESPWDGANTLDQVSDAGFVDDDISSGNNYGLDADWHLVAGSICIDRADSDAATTLDPEGNPRYDDPLVTNNGTGTYSYYDIGVYEYQGVGGPQIETLQGSSAGSSTASAYVYSPGIQTLACQTDGISTAIATVSVPGSGGQLYATLEDDNYLTASSQSTNNGTSDSLYVYRTVADTLWCRLSILRFDFTGVPDEAEITIADLGMFLWGDPASGVTMYVRHLESVGNAFTELGSCWDTYDGTNQWDSGDFTSADWTTVNQASDVTTGIDGHWMNFDIVDMVQHALDSHSKVLEIVVTADTGDAYFDYNSKNYGEDIPYLDITYTGVGATYELLAGQSDGVATVNGAISSIIGLDGASNGLSTAGALAKRTREIVGASDGLSAVAATVTQIKAIAGASDGVSTAGIPVLKAIREIAGVSDGSSTAIALLGAVQKLAGITTGVSTVGTDLDISKKLAGFALCNSNTEANVQVFRNISGASAGLSTASGSVVEITNLSGSSDGIATVYNVPILKAISSFIGSSDGIATVGVTLQVTKTLIGQTDGVATVSNLLNILTPVDGSSEGTSTVSATLVKDVVALAGATDGLSTTGSTVNILKKLVGFTGGVSTTASTIFKTRSIVGSSVGGSTTSGLVKAIREVAGATDGGSTAGASLDEATQLVGTTAGGSTATVTIDVLKVLSGVTNGTSTVTATVDEDRWLKGNSGGTSTVTVLVEVSKKLGGATNGVTLLTGILGVLRKVAGATDGLSTSNGLVMITRSVIGATDGSSTSIGNVMITRSIGGAAIGSSTTAGLAKILKELIGISTGASTASTTLEEKTKMSGTSNGTSNASIDVNVTKELSGDSDGSSTTTAALLETTDLAGTTGGASTVSAVPKTERTIAGTTGGNSTATAGVEEATWLSCDHIYGSSYCNETPVFVTRGLVGQANGLSTAQATMQERTRLQGSTTGSSTVQADVGVTKLFAGSADGIAAIGALVTCLRAFVGQALGLSNVDNVLLKVDKELAGNSDGSARIENRGATLDILKTLIGSSTGTCVVTAIPMLKVIRTVNGLAAGQSTTSGTFYVLFVLSGVTNGTCTITIYNLAVGTIFTVTIAGTSTATMALGKIRYHQLGYCSTSRPKAKGRMIVIRPK